MTRVAKDLANQHSHTGLTKTANAVPLAVVARRPAPRGAHRPAPVPPDGRQMDQWRARPFPRLAATATTTTAAALVVAPVVWGGPQPIRGGPSLA